MTINVRQTPMNWERHREVIRAAVALTAIINLAAGVAIGWTIEHRRHAVRERATVAAPTARVEGPGAGPQGRVLYNTYTAPNTVARPVEIGPTQAPANATPSFVLGSGNVPWATAGLTWASSPAVRRNIYIQRGYADTVHVDDLTARVCVPALPPSMGKLCASAGWLSEFWWPVAGQ